MKFVSKFGCEKVRVLEFVKNRGKGGAVRMVWDTLSSIPLSDWLYRIIHILKYCILYSMLSGCLFQIVYSHSLIQGCLSTRGERILFVDADGATKIADVERLEKALDALTTDNVSHSYS